MKRKLYLLMLIGMFWIVNGGEVLSQQMDHLHSLVLDPQTSTLDEHPCYGNTPRALRESR